MTDGQVDDLQINELKSLNCFGVFSNLDNAYYDDDDDELHIDTQAQAYFQRNIDVGGSLRLGVETSVKIDGVTTYTNSGGNILVKINGVTYTITPTILSYISTISDNIQTQINNIDLSSYAPLASPTFTGTPLLTTNPADNDNSKKIASTEWVKNQGYFTTPPFSYAPLASPTFTGTPISTTPATTDDSTKIATTAFVKAQGYLTTSPDLTLYAPLASPTFTGTPLLTTNPADNDNSKKIASTEWVKNQGYTTTPNNFSLYAPLASPTFTGTPLLTTNPADNDNSKKIASTEWVKNQGYTTTSPDLTSYAPLASPSFTGTPISTTPATTDDSTKIATTAFVKAQGYLTTSPDLSAYAPKDNPTFITKITTPYLLLSEPIYCELGGNFNPTDEPYTNSSPFIFYVTKYTATYTAANAIIGYSTSQAIQIVLRQNYHNGNFRNYVTSGYDKFTYGWNNLNGYWRSPQTGKYKICINFYIQSNDSGNKFSLIKYNTYGNPLYSQYCLVGDTITTDTIRNFSTILPMNIGDYFKIVLTTYAGNAVMLFEGTNTTSMKIMLLG